MPSPPRRSGLWLGLAGAGLLAIAAMAGWWVGGWQSTDSRRAERSADRQVDLLLPVVQQGKATPAQQQRLLELLVALNRRPQAIALLETLADRQPERWSLRLLLAELRREQGDRIAAERELRQLLALQPDRIEALQLMALLLLESGRGLQAESLVQAALNRARTPSLTPRALNLGLLLANIQQKQGHQAKAQSTLATVAAEFPRDPRPLLAAALLYREAGDAAAAQRALIQARGISSGPLQGRLDQMAAAWGLETLQRGSVSQQGSRYGQTNPVLERN